MMALLSNEADVRVDKRPMRRHGCGVSRVLPEDKTSKRTCRDSSQQQCAAWETATGGGATAAALIDASNTAHRQHS
jgi:hypothetical protein